VLYKTKLMFIPVFSHCKCIRKHKLAAKLRQLFTPSLSAWFCCVVALQITDWEYYGGQRSPFDPSMPQRTISRGGSTVINASI
jgi:hypothetical protein